MKKLVIIVVPQTNQVPTLVAWCWNFGWLSDAPCLSIRPHCCPAKLVFWHGFRSKHEKTLRFTQLCCNIHTCCLALECWLAALRSVSKPDLELVWHGRAAHVHTSCLVLEFWLAERRSVSKPDLEWAWHGRAARVHTGCLALECWLAERRSVSKPDLAGVPHASTLVAWRWNAGWLSYALSRSQTWNCRTCVCSESQPRLRRMQSGVSLCCLMHFLQTQLGSVLAWYSLVRGRAWPHPPWHGGKAQLSQQVPTLAFFGRSWPHLTHLFEAHALQVQLGQFLARSSLFRGRACPHPPWHGGKAQPSHQVSRLARAGRSFPHALHFPAHLLHTQLGRFLAWYALLRGRVLPHPAWHGGKAQLSHQEPGVANLCKALPHWGHFFVCAGSGGLEARTWHCLQTPSLVFFTKAKKLVRHFHWPHCVHLLAFVALAGAAATHFL